jgi:hypothetical protein
LHSRPGVEVTTKTGRPVDVDQVIKQLGDASLQELQIWRLYGGWLGSDFVWQAKASPEVIGKLQQVFRLKQIQVSQVPAEFWSMPPDWSDVPNWWKPTPTIAGAVYYMSPTFVPHSVANDRLDGVVMYDPEQQRVYVWSQWDF